MGRDFVSTGPDYIDFGNVSGAEHNSTSDWTCYAFFKWDSGAADGTVLSRRKTAGNSDQFAIKIESTSGPFIQVRMAGTTQITGSVFSANTWYLVIVKCDTAQSNKLRYSLLQMDGTYVDQDANGTATNAVDNTGNNKIGSSGTTNVNPLDGQVAYASYFAERIPDDQDFLYLFKPRQLLATYLDTCKFFVECGRLNGSNECDFSGNGNHGTISGTTVVYNPPFGKGSGFEFFPAAAAAGGPLFFKHYYPNMRKQGCF